MNIIFKLAGIVGLHTKEAEEGLDKVSKKGEKTKSNMSKAFAKIGKGAKVLGTSIATGIGTGMTALVGVGKKALESYADYEQLVGGVDTLFKDSSKKVQQYASEAYKEAGLSANQYMETATSFSASLLQSLGGDTDKAAEMANMAIIDMSNNANKMGTSMESIQVAYQGFAKQNYTMLDNLKIGYGGTKEEMQRLLSDAEKLSGVKYDISSYADVVSAIHVIQDEIGMTNATAEEARNTIQGSLGMVKGAWANLLTGMTDEKQDLGKLLQNFLDSVIIFAKNVTPKISSLLPRIVEALEKIIAQLIIQIPNFVLQLLPPLIEGATKLLNGIVYVLPELLGTLMGILPVILTSIMSLIVGIIAELPRILQPIIISLPSIIKDILDAILKNLPTIINGLVSLIEMVVEAMPQIMEELINYMPTAIEQILYALVSCLPALLKALALMVKATLDYFITVKLGMIKKIPDFIKGIALGIGNALLPWYEKLTASISHLWQRIKDKFTAGFSALKNSVSNGLSAIKGKFDNAFNRLKEIVRNAIDRIRSFFNFNWSLPKLKMPHIKIDGSFGLSPLKVPKFKIDWYAKAMNSGMIMNKPTIFGYNNATGNFMAGGEAGSETVVGTNSLMTMIKAAVQNENAELAVKLENLINLIERYFPQFLESLGFDVVLDTGALVGHTAKSYDEALGDLSSRRRVVFK